MTFLLFFFCLLLSFSEFCTENKNKKFLIEDNKTSFTSFIILIQSNTQNEGRIQQYGYCTKQSIKDRIFHVKNFELFDAEHICWFVTSRDPTIKKALAYHADKEHKVSNPGVFREASELNCIIRQVHREGVQENAKLKGRKPHTDNPEWFPYIRALKAVSQLPAKAL